MKKSDIPRRMVHMSLTTYEKACQLQTKIQEKIGLEVPLGRVIERGIECLDDAYNRGAWLSPKEAAPRFERRIKESMMDLTELLLARVAPDRKLKKIDFQGDRYGFGLMMTSLLCWRKTQAERRPQARS